jgi:ABC-type multidrug transport system fused ATPase/permease subunit
VGERGARLSGGQQQRIAIARAFLKDGPILILDEPTAHLDKESADSIGAALARLAVGRTVLIIAHRMALVIGAERIFVLDEGCGVEKGSHVELMALQGTYSRLVSSSDGGERRESREL